MARSEGLVDPASRDKYLLQVTAGPSYDTATHREVAVNNPEAHMIENDIITCWLNVRIRDYHGLPRGSPDTSNYFDHRMHKTDRYSVGFSFVPKKDIPGKDLVTGFDFDHSIRDRLPPGFKYAMKIVTTILDPGIYSDPYSDTPYLYGPALSSFFTFRIGEHIDHVSAEDQLKSQLKQDAAGIIEEGADGSGSKIRQEHAIPLKASKRRKNFLNPQNLKNFTFEAGRLYQSDFFNPYLDFANFALRIPGFSISVSKYIDDKTHQLRYVIKNRRTEEVLFVVVFTLLFGQKLENALESERLQSNKREQSASQSTPNAVQRPWTPSDRCERPETSSSNETAAPSSRSSSPERSDFEVEETRYAAASMLADSIHSGLAALGFGRTANSSEASSVSPSKESSPERPGKPLDERVEEMHEAKVEEFLKEKYGN